VAITIDGATRRIILDSANVSVAQIWSAWVDWRADNPQWLMAFRQVGGDDLGGGLFIPAYFFLTNNWRVRPMEADQTLTVTGNLFVDGGGDPIVSTLGVFNVLTKLVVPVQAQGISTGGANYSPAQIAAAVVAAMQTQLDRIDVAISTRTKPSDLNVLM
jgi:hypothetical protein